MGKYGEAAIRAREILLGSSRPDPGSAWKAAVEKIFPDSSSSREKSCPRGAFLGLCSDGLVSGVPSGEYTRSRDNRQYARDAVRLIRQKPSLADTPVQLWGRVMRGEEKVENSQMDVVISLWQAGAISNDDV